MAKIKKVIFGLFVAMFAVVALSSCNKENDDTPVVSETVATPSEEVVARDLSKQISPQAMSSYTEYYVAQKYKNAYRHVKQGHNECSWTSYVLAAAAVARADGSSYPNDKSYPEIDDYKSKIAHAKRNSSYYITSIESYSKRFDMPKYSTIKIRREAYNSYSDAVVCFLGERQRGNQKPCIFISSAPSQNGGKIGHYLILWDVMWNGDPATSFVNVTDPLKGDREILDTYGYLPVTYQMTLEEVLKANVNRKFNFLYFDWSN